MNNIVPVDQLRIGGFDASRKLSPAIAPQNMNVAAGARKSFGEVLGDALKKDLKVEFSAHATKRIQSRGITMRPEDYERLNRAFEALSARNAKESLVMVDEKAFLLSVRNRTVITVMDKNEMKNNVFSNIDSAMIA